MIAGLLRVLIKLAVAAAIVLLSLTILGDYLRQLVSEPYRGALWRSGLLIFFPCLVGVALLGRFPPAKRRRFENLLIVGAIVGALLFILFITDIECTLTPGTRPGLRCNFVGEE